MSARFRLGMAVIVVLLLAGGLFAGQEVVLSGATTRTLTGTGLTASPGSRSSGVLGTMHDNDVSVTALLPVPDIYMPYGDTFFPQCVVQNLGTQTQTNVPVICVVYDTAAGSPVHGPDTVYVATLYAGGVDTVEFTGWLPPAEDRVYYDTMTTALSGDEDTTNDWKPGRVTVSDWGEGHLTYNDGTFENAISWIMPGCELTERFAAPERPLTLSKAVLWLSSFSGDDYDAEVRVYGNDGSPHGYPGTELGAWVGKLQTDTWMTFHKNQITFDPPITVDFDTFFVSYYETSVSPAYPYLAMDTIADTIDIGNDWGKWIGWGPDSGWGIFSAPGMSDSNFDLGIDAFYDAAMLDGSVKDITVPQGSIDSNTTFTPQVVVKNAGLCDRANIQTRFYIVSTTGLGDTVYSGIANSGPIRAGQTKAVTFGQSITPAPGYYTMTSITLLPYDARPHNDTLVKPLAVGRLGIAADRNAVGRATLTIAPNPLVRTATVRYSLPKAGFVKLDVYDASGRSVLSQSIVSAGSGTVKLDLRELEAGVYIIKVNAGDFSSTQKLVIQHH